MTLRLFTGRQNSGKTLGLSLWAFQDWLSGREVYTNTPFIFPHILINKDFLSDIVSKGISIKNASFVLDEAWLWIDSRKRDTTLSYFYLQSSKDNLNVNLSAQTDRQIDIRLRENLHYWVDCSRVIYVKNQLIPIPRKYEDKRKDLPKTLQDLLFIQFDIFTPVSSIRRRITLDDFELYKRRIIYAKKIYSLFDTEKKVKVDIEG